VESHPSKDEGWAILRVGFSRKIFISPLAQGGAGRSSDQGEAKGYVEDGEGVEHQSGKKQRDQRYQLGVMKDVVEKQKKESRGNDYEDAVKSVGETEMMPEDEASHAQQKQDESERSQDPGSPGDVPVV
jgi:hypothetical protein